MATACEFDLSLPQSLTYESPVRAGRKKRGPRCGARAAEARGLGYPGGMPAMDAPRNSMIGSQLSDVVAAFKSGWRVIRHRGPNRIQFWFIALLIGIAAGFAALFFRKGITWLQQTLYGTENVRLIHSFAETLPW